MTKFQRVYEAAILRTLGASTRMLGTMLALEYGGARAARRRRRRGRRAGAQLGGVALRLRHPWRPAPGLAAIGAVVTMVLVGIIGVSVQL